MAATGLAAGLTAVEATAGRPDGSWHTPTGAAVPNRYWASKATAARTGLARLAALAEPLRRTARPDRDHWHYAPIRAAASVERWSSSPGVAREPRSSGACREQTRNRTRGGEGDSGPPWVIAGYPGSPWCAAFPTSEATASGDRRVGVLPWDPARSSR